MAGKKGKLSIGGDNLHELLAMFGREVATCIAEEDMDMSVMEPLTQLGTVPDTILYLIDLLAKEGSKKNPDEELVGAYLLMFSVFLADIGFLDDDMPEKQERLGEVQEKLRELAEHGKLSSELLFMMLHAFSEAHLDVGDTLREALGAAVMAKPVSLEEEFDVLSSNENPFAELLEQVEGDVFQFSDILLESANMMSPEVVAQMLPVTLFAEEKGMREGVLGCLLSNNPKMREGLLNILGDAALQGKITPVMLRRMIAMRNWLPEDERPGLDIAIKNCRKTKVNCESWPKMPKIREIWTSGVDGAGAQTLFVVVKEGRRHAVVSILLKQGKGVRDAWVQHQMTLGEIREMFRKIKFELDLYENDMAYVTTALRSFLSINAQSGEMPQYRLLEVAEAIGMSDTNPIRKSVRALVDELYGMIPGKKGNQVIADIMLHSKDLPENHGVAQSWFVDGTEVDKIAGGKGSLKKKKKLLLDGPMEKKRDWWAELFVWMGLMLMHSDLAEGNELEDNSGDWLSFVLIAREILDGRPLRDIPLMQIIAEESLEDPGLW